MEPSQNQQKSTSQTKKVSTNVSSSPQLIKIMADNESNKRVICHWATFFGLIIAIYIITFMIPIPLVEMTPIQPFQDKEKNCPEQISNDENYSKMCQGFDWDLNPVIGVPIINVNETNQFLVVQMNFTKLEGSEGTDISQLVKFEYSYLVIDPETLDITSPIFMDIPHQIKIECNEHDEDFKYMCQTRWVIYVPEIVINHQLFMFKFTNPQEIKQKLDIQSVSYIYMNNNFTNFLIGVKYTLMTLSVFAFCAFFFRLRKLNQGHWVIEQKFILALSVALIFFNDPFYAITILNPNKTGAFFSVLWLVSFLVLLFIFWILALKRIVEDNAKKNTKAFNCKLIAFGIVIWLFLLITYVGFSYEYQEDPGTEFYDEFPVFYEICKYTGIVLLTVYLLYLIFLYFRIYQVYKTRIWRHKLFSIFSAYFIFAMGFFLYLGTPHVYTAYGERIFLFITVFNMYIFYMQFMYSPSAEGLKEAAQNQDLEFPQQNQIYEMLDESIQIQEVNFEQNLQQEQQQQPQLNANAQKYLDNNKNENNQQQQQQQFGLEDDDNLDEEESNQQQQQQQNQQQNHQADNIDQIYNDV